MNPFNFANSCAQIDNEQHLNYPSGTNNYGIPVKTELNDQPHHFPQPTYARRFEQDINNYLHHSTFGIKNEYAPCDYQRQFSLNPEVGWNSCNKAKIEQQPASSSSETKDTACDSPALRALLTRPKNKNNEGIASKSKSDNQIVTPKNDAIQQYSSSEETQSASQTSQMNEVNDECVPKDFALDSPNLNVNYYPWMKSSTGEYPLWNKHLILKGLTTAELPLKITCTYLLLIQFIIHISYVHRN